MPVFKYLNTYCVPGLGCFGSHSLFLFTSISRPSLCSALHIKTTADGFLGFSPAAFGLEIGEEENQAISPLSFLHVWLHPYFQVLLPAPPLLSHQ